MRSLVVASLALVLCFGLQPARSEAASRLDIRVVGAELELHWRPAFCQKKAYVFVGLNTVATVNGAEGFARITNLPSATEIVVLSECPWVGGNEVSVGRVPSQVILPLLAR